MKKYLYKGQIVTASSKEEAKKIVANLAKDIFFKESKVPDSEYESHCAITPFKSKSGNAVLEVLPKSIDEDSYSCYLSLNVNNSKATAGINDNIASKDTNAVAKATIEAVKKELNKDVYDLEVLNFHITKKSSVTVTIKFKLDGDADKSEAKKIVEKADKCTQLSFINKLK